MRKLDSISEDGQLPRGFHTVRVSARAKRDAIAVGRIERISTEYMTYDDRMDAGCILREDREHGGFGLFAGLMEDLANEEVGQDSPPAVIDLASMTDAEYRKLESEVGPDYFYTHVVDNQGNLREIDELGWMEWADSEIQRD